MNKKEKTILFSSVIVTAVAGFFHYTHSNQVAAFVITALLWLF